MPSFGSASWRGEKNCFSSCSCTMRATGCKGKLLRIEIVISSCEHRAVSAEGQRVLLVDVAWWFFFVPLVGLMRPVTCPTMPEAGNQPSKHCRQGFADCAQPMSHLARQGELSLSIECPGSACASGQSAVSVHRSTGQPNPI